MSNLVLNCDTVSVSPPSRANVLVIPVKYIEKEGSNPIVVGASGSIDYSSLNDGTIVFEY